jgi:hypothetical protein
MARADMQLWQRVETRAAIHQITICSQFDEAREELRCFLASHRAGPAPYGMNALDWHDVTMAWADAEIQCMLQRGYLFAVHVVIEAATYYQWKRGDFEHLERAEPIPGTVPDEVGLIKRGFVPEGGVRMPDGSYVSRGGKGSTFEGKKVSGPSDKAWDTDEARKGRNKWSEEEKAALAAKGSSPRKIAGQNTFYATKVIPNDLFWARVDDHCLQKAAAGKQHKLPTKATVPLILNTSVWKTSTPLRKDAQAKAVEADDGETEKVVGRDIDVDGQADEQG